MEREEVIQIGKFHYRINFISSCALRENEVCPCCGNPLVGEEVRRVKKIINQERGLPLEISRQNPFLKKLYRQLTQKVKQNSGCPHCLEFPSSAPRVLIVCA